MMILATICFLPIQLYCSKDTILCHLKHKFAVLHAYASRTTRQTYASIGPYPFWCASVREGEGQRVQTHVARKLALYLMTKGHAMRPYLAMHAEVIIVSTS